MYSNEDYVTFRKGVLTFPDGRRVEVKKVGQGHFARVYLTRRRPYRVFAIIKDDAGDWSKDILAEINRDTSSKHLPKVEKVGLTYDGNVYEMPLYQMPLRKADSPEAWRQYRALKACWDDALGNAARKGGWRTGIIYEGYRINQDTIECARKARVGRGLVRALQLLADQAANYGSSMMFEFAPRNLGTDSRGNLILVDTLFDMEVIAREHQAKQRQRMGG